MESMAFLDGKGTVTAMTINWRRRVCGPENVKVANPEGLLVDERPDLKSDGWNPIDLDPSSPTFHADCQSAAYALIKSGSNPTQKFFPDGARKITDGLTMGEVIRARLLSEANVLVGKPRVS
jgi:hypothetical protein